MRGAKLSFGCNFPITAKDCYDMERQRHIVVLGAGFGGLTFCQHFHHPNARVTIIDRQNHHLFQPLLYQVASAGLAAPDIAQPVRSVLAREKNLDVIMDDVVGVDLTRKEITLSKGTLKYDYLVLALGGVTSYFGHPEWEQFAPGLKTLDDAVRIRRNILLAFEKAEHESDPELRAKLLTIVVVGGGPTGVELAGAFAELRRYVLAKDFDHIDPTRARVILIEASPRVLSHLSEYLSQQTEKTLAKLGVETRSNTRVKNITAGCVELESGEKILAENIIWAAGVSATPLTQKLGVDIDKGGRVKVTPELSIPNHPEVFAIGDMAQVLDKEGKPVPGVSPAAMQMAKHVSGIIYDELEFPGRSRRAFKYWDKGTMATIGRSAAVAKIKRLEFDGFLAWIAWLVIHLFFLVGFRNKFSVLWQWAYSYFTYKRGARIITGVHKPDVTKTPGSMV
jgi:NADH dehydrogenase